MASNTVGKSRYTMSYSETQSEKKEHTKEMTDTRPDSFKTLALYKPFTYLLTYLLRYTHINIEIKPNHNVTVNCNNLF